jgi:hypothetical protein
MLTCSRCKQEKDEDDFYSNRSSPTGRSQWCRRCFNEYMKKRRAENPGMKSAEGKKYRLKYPGRSTINNKKYLKSHPAKRREKKKRYKLRHPEKDKAREAIHRAVRYNKIDKPKTCSMLSAECKGKIDGHHSDYSKPLDVIWVCDYHHKKLHRLHVSTDQAGEARGNSRRR